MASVKTLVRLKRAGEYHPPGTIFHDFDLVEAESLGARVVILDRGDAPALADQIVDPDRGGALPPAPPSVDGTSPGTVTAPVPGGGEGRVAEIMHAFDLLDEGDWTGTGKPRVRALADVLGYKPTPEEISAALSLRDAL